jgi:hypothetical protein
MGKYSAIKDKWGVLPVYVGQQDERTGHGSYEPSSILIAEQGAIDGADACNLLAGEGFQAGTFVYLDWEYGGLDGEGSSDYIKAWISAVVEDGRARPGIYCSHVVAQPMVIVIDAINPTPITRFWCWKVPNANSHDFQGDISLAVPDSLAPPKQIASEAVHEQMLGEVTDASLWSMSQQK